MSKSQKKGRCPRKVLRIPDLEQSKHAVLNSLPAKASQESYGHAIDEFISWYCSEPRLASKRTVVLWTVRAAITEGNVFRRVNKHGKVWGDGITPKAIWHVVRAAAQRAGIPNLAPHDLRRTCARLCHLAGGELEQIQFLLGHVSVQTTERYLGCKQRLRHAVNDQLGFESP
jgi:integrase